MLRYSEIPRDLSADSIATLKISESNEDNYFKPNDSESSSTNLGLPEDYSSSIINRIHRKISTPCTSSAGINLPYSYYNYGSALSNSHNTNSATSLQSKTQSLPSNARNYSCAVLDILRITPEELAGQLTLLDLPSFLNIQPDELTSCAWNKKNKLTISPNVVGFTRRFNHVSFWTVQEILSGSTPKQRSDILSHFIRVAKKLYDLNNLHSLFAIISALQSASIYRLSKTWGSISKKEKQTFDKLAEVFSDTNNWSNLRSHIERLKLPCIPYLGLYLTDLVYIDMAHPHSGGLESQQRSFKMNNILRVISNYQLSNYSSLQVLPHVQDYLNSVRYIEELQKFVEDDQYKLSMKLEPPSPPPSSSSCSSKESVVIDGAAIASLNLSPAKVSSGSLRLHHVTSSNTNKFIPTHRKSRSLGTKFRSASLPRNFHKQWSIFNKNHQISNLDSKDLPKTLHLLDDSELEESHSNNVALTSPCSDMHSQATRLNTAEDSKLLTGISEDCIGNETSVLSMQGCVRRKTVLKHGRKPTVSSWQRYWIQIWASSLAYFAPKSFKGNLRSDFKSEPCKMVSLLGNQIVFGENTLHPDLFQIVDHQRGNIYKFRAGSETAAMKWCRHLHHATSGEQSPLPSNLMSFE